MVIEGVDAYGKPTPAGLVAVGRKFVARYLKNVTRAEIDADHAAGLTVVLISETTGRRALEGSMAGVECGRADLLLLHALGVPPGVAVYWAEDDLDVQPAQVPAIVQAAKAYRATLAGYRTGFYGGLRAVTAVGEAGAADFLWQTYGWSGGKWYPKVTLEQYLNGQNLPGAVVDFDRALTPAYGGWRCQYHEQQRAYVTCSLRGNEIYGRGTLDTKTLGIVELEAFLALHRSHTPLDRDVIFMATADEEAGGVFGAQWVVQHHPEAFRGAGFLINEGSMGSVDGTRQSFAIEVTQKTPFWLKLTTTGKAGHGSTPPPASAVNRLIRALYRLQTYDFAPRVVSAVATYFAAIAPTASPKWKDVLTNPATLTTDHNALAEFQIDLPELAALVRNTCSITGLQGSNKINVVPPEASALVDCRLLPDQDHEAFLREFTGVLNDPDIKVDKIIDFTPAVTATNTPLYDAIVAVVHRHFPDASIAPSVETGFTDSHWFRDLGIASYGFAPFMVPEAEQSGVHGNNERLSVENIRRGTQMMLEIVSRVVSE